jgi:hypothetical protein
MLKHKKKRRKTGKDATEIELEPLFKSRKIFYNDSI